MTYIEPQNKQKRQRKRDVIWFNPPFNVNVATNVAKSFLALIDKHFPRHHRYHKLFNKNNVKSSYSCMSNVVAIISSHNARVLAPVPDKASRTCNCRQLSKYIWEVKDNNQPYEINWSIAQRAAAYKCGTRRCDICVTEKTVIAAADPSSTLNKRAEIVSTCRHRAKFRYGRVSGAPTWWASRLGLMWEASGHRPISLSWWWTMVAPTQLCWRYHGSPLGQRYIIYHPAPPSLVIHGHLTLTPQCTL